MSYINIHTVKFEHGSEEKTDVEEFPIQLPDLSAVNETDSFRGGEELMAVQLLLKVLDDLGEGEALVAWKAFL